MEALIQLTIAYAGNRGDSGLAKETVHPIARGSLGPRARR